MNPISRTLPPSSTGPSAPIGLDWIKRPFNATVSVYTTGACSLGMEFTMDDLMTNSPTNVRWQPSTEIPTGTTASKVVNLITPYTGIRLNVASNAAAIEWRVIQG
jgi:hypothetical protein